MAGHSHWAQIKRAKGANDAKRGQLFSRFSREITISAQLGGGDPGFNTRLRTAIATAKAQSMPADRIDRAIKKGTGELGGEALMEIVYEGYAPGGVAIIVESTTDNKNRAAAEMRTIFSKNNSNLATPGSVLYQFQKKASFLVSADSEDAVLEATLDAEPDDVRDAGKSEEDAQLFEILAAPDKFDAVEKALKEAGMEAREARFTYIPDTLTPVTDEAIARQILRLMEKLEESDEVQNVHANFDISDEIMQAIQSDA